MRSDFSVDETSNKCQGKHKDEVTNEYNVGIVGNWTSANYGAQLTYYALYKTLADMDKNVVMIERAGLGEKEENGLFAENPYPKNVIKKSYATITDMKELNDSCDTFVLGSDQLWRYGLFEQHSMNEFMLSFANCDIRKISYATSFGFPEIDIPPKYISKAKYLMNRLQKVSVREKTGVDICKKTFGVQAEQVLDPVFLCNVSYYKELMVKSTSEKKDSYIFCYIPYNKNIENIIHIIENMAERLDKKIVCVCNVSKETFNFGDEKKLILDEKKCKIEDWLYYLYNSDMVITTSYHGYCFSLIFNKQVLAMFSNTNVLERANSLAETLNIVKPYLIDDFNIESCFSEYLIDYNVANERLASEISRSIKWLEDALNSKIEYEKSDLLWDAIGTEIADIFSENDEYKRKINRNRQEKRNTVIFGAGLILDDYYKEISQITHPMYIVDNNEKKWGMTMYDGIECVAPETLKDIDNPYVIIAVKNENVINSIKKQLNDMGIRDIVHIFEFIKKKDR